MRYGVPPCQAAFRRTHLLWAPCCLGGYDGLERGGADHTGTYKVVLLEHSANLKTFAKLLPNTCRTPAEHLPNT